MAENLPPIHDLVRFWHLSGASTMGACLSFRRTPAPVVTLGWLRKVAPIVMTRELPETALRNAVRQKVYPEAQASVLKAVELFVRFADNHQWSGNSLAPSAYRLPNGRTTKIEAIGRYFSKKTNSNWLVALQPRQEECPNDEQLRMWRSALVYEFQSDDEGTMIVDLSKGLVTHRRELRQVTSRKFSLLSKDELDARLDQVSSYYEKAIELIPERPHRPPRKDDDPDFGF
ncbi:hypothetical protein SAMN03159423_0846 [Bradyrhizobium sp. NFR13]|uniref:hypothetical protein n=1 Tax=Bradyrhizobium sp. NFR13 TaxID=1566285 RepID=UPI0008E81460|nr:hypothetical protein [Bradyrhizobium sp. NFR13]SFL28547.1 hypothetical protein SAMN03159423_0846 [Bradyrhizobium sp. NFR13]